MGRLIDADELKDIVEYACDEDGSEEALKWCNWFKEAINAEYNRQQNRQKKEVKPIEASPRLSVEDSKKIIKEVYTKPHYKRGQRKREEMNSPCTNCGADVRVCKECDWYNGKWIPKDQYEARLKADMVAMLTEIQLEIEEKKFLESSCSFMDKTEEKNYAVYTDDISKIIQQKIDALKEQTDDSN